MTLLAIVTDDVWSPGIGDPTVFGWLITLAYIAAAGVCLRAWKHEAQQLRSAARPLRPAFWLGLSLVMLVLATNKQLDLQSLLTVTGRRLALAQGWYEGRARVQTTFVISLVALGMVIMIGTLWWVRLAWRGYVLAISGLAFLTCFILLRAASFHHVDAMLFRLPIFGRAANRILELAGILLIATAAARAARRTHHVQP